jgi:hypothetical protein
LKYLRLKSRAIRVNPEGPGAAQACGEWPRSITAMMTKNKSTDGIRDSAGRNMMRASLAVPVPRAKRAQVRVCHEAKKITQFRDVQLAVLIAIGHLELRLDKTQQLSLAYLAVIAASALFGVFRHSE